ncbi:MAG TPA: two-component regulator propeller domain-containing protein [Nitrospiria bacterium]|nr:two-component regulator propeller domain-containing protein [Nitrospiria bacterium]
MRPLATGATVSLLMVFCGFAPAACSRAHPPEPAAASKPAPPAASPRPRFTNFETGGNVKALALDGPNLWLGLPNGLIRYDTRTSDTHEVITSRSTRSGLLSDGIYMIYLDGAGNKWIGTYGGGLMRYDNRQWTAFTPFGFGSPLTYGAAWKPLKSGTGIADLWVYDMAVDHQGVSWIATWKGATRYDGKTFQTFTDKNGLADKWVYAVAVDRDNLIWFGTEGGLSRYNPATKEWTSWTHADGLGLNVPDEPPAPANDPGYGHHGTQRKSNMGPNPNYILDIVIDADNVKWIGTWGAGLSRFDSSAPAGLQWKSFSKADGLGGHYVHVLKFDSAGRLWIGTNGGLTIYDHGRWTTYTTKEGLLDNNVFSLAFGEHGVVWAGTWKGLSKFEPPPRMASR